MTDAEAIYEARIAELSDALKDMLRIVGDPKGHHHNDWHLIKNARELLSDAA
jgi:hypothetical protein